MSPMYGRRSTAYSEAQARQEDESTTYSPTTAGDEQDSGLATSPFGTSGGEDSNHSGGGSGPLGGVDPATVGMALAGLYLAYRGLS